MTNVARDKLLYMRLKANNYNGLYEKSLNGDVVFISNDLDSGDRDEYLSPSPASSPRPHKSSLNRLSEGRTSSNMGLRRGKCLLKPSKLAAFFKETESSFQIQA